MMKTASLPQTFRGYDKESMERIQRSRVKLEHCVATSPDDLIMIKAKSDEIIKKNGLTQELFDDMLNHRIFSKLLESLKAADAMKLHILCVGNSGVGTSTVLKSMVPDTASNPVFGS